MIDTTTTNAPPPTAASYNPSPSAIDTPLCAKDNTDEGAIVARTSDPRIYARAATLSTFSSRYVMDNVKFSSCISKEDMPVDLDDPIVKWQPFDQRNGRVISQECSWFAFGGDASFVVDADKVANIVSSSPSCRS
jgi:hypothetical protein